MKYNFIVICQPRICGFKRIVKNEKLSQFRSILTNLNVLVPVFHWNWPKGPNVALFCSETGIFICSWFHMQIFESVFSEIFVTLIDMPILTRYESYRIGHSVWQFHMKWREDDAKDVNNILDTRVIILKAILRNNCNFSLYLELDKNLSSWLSVFFSDCDYFSKLSIFSISQSWIFWFSIFQFSLSVSD